ncbi:unnamed protein product [Danaus chrysippus]|uniref:(African queen) hypothetical protein n=1 Tax=Danaus chrysippus TaxID=151541 RepID=A0A8J2W848_9NEOP|nr:unnamed protein product [Danaus chrysippus]
MVHGEVVQTTKPVLRQEAASRPSAPLEPETSPGPRPSAPPPRPRMPLLLAAAGPPDPDKTCPSCHSSDAYKCIALIIITRFHVRAAAGASETESRNWLIKIKIRFKSATRAERNKSFQLNLLELFQKRCTKRLRGQIPRYKCEEKPTAIASNYAQPHDLRLSIMAMLHYNVLTPQPPILRPGIDEYVIHMFNITVFNQQS